MKEIKVNELKSDLQLVCEMQRKIDIYECYFNDLFLLVSNKDDVRDGKVSVPSILRGTEADELYGKIFCEVENLIRHPSVKIENYGVGLIQEMTKNK